jgi:hypothetical protein
LLALFVGTHVVAKPPGRASAKMIGDVEMLRAVADHGAEAMNAFIGIPSKVVIQKQRRMVERGLLTPNWSIARKGAEMLHDADELGVIE